MYYVAIQDAVSGPHTVEELGQMLMENKITPVTLAVVEGQENWMALERLIDIQPGYAPNAGVSDPSHEGLHVSKAVKQGKECPFCGGRKVKSAAKEFYTTGFARVFSPKVCNRCDAIWAPKVDVSTAFLIFAIGIVGVIAAMIIAGPEVAYRIGIRETQPAPIGPSPVVNWILGGVVLMVSLTAASRSFRYLASAKVRAFRILRHPVHQVQG